MLERILPVYRTGLGGALGSGRQWLSWIALDDLVGILYHMIFDETLSGPVNAVEPRRLVETGFRHRHPDLEAALRMEIGSLTASKGEDR